MAASLEQMRCWHSLRSAVSGRCWSWPLLCCGLALCELACSTEPRPPGLHEAAGGAHDRGGAGGTGDTGAAGLTGSGGLSGAAGAGAECEPRKARAPFGLDPDFGQSFPDLDVQNCAGQAHSAADVRCGQRLTLISVGAGWCAPCLKEAPHLEALSRELAEEQIGVAQILFEDAAGQPAAPKFCNEWSERFELTFPVFLDPEHHTDVLIGGAIQSLTPLNVVVDERGKVLWAQTGVVPDDMDQILRELRSRTQ